MLVSNMLVSNITEQRERRKPAVGDQMLQAVIFHSDNLELSEQFDATSRYEKSVSNLTWSCASFLSAIRARNAI
jgi:glucoamylase